jgi:hypothetical protein
MRESNDGKDGRAYTGVVDWVTGVIGVMVMGVLTAVIGVSGPC